MQKNNIIWLVTLVIVLVIGVMIGMNLKYSGNGNQSGAVSKTNIYKNTSSGSSSNRENLNACDAEAVQCYYGCSFLGTGSTAQDDCNNMCAAVNRKCNSMDIL